jgi:uncharacterized membrane protein (UPF0127 family)
MRVRACLALFATLLVSLALAGYTEEAAAQDATRTVAITTSNGEKIGVKARVADSAAERQRGLMGRRAKLAENAGMLFVFGHEQWLSFWMKNTYIPLSIAFIDTEGRIVDIQDMQPLDTIPHVSAEPARYALEVNQGFFAERGIEVGDEVELSPLRGDRG